MCKRPPYLEVIATVLVMTFLTLIVIGGINPRTRALTKSPCAQATEKASTETTSVASWPLYHVQHPVACS